MANKFAEAGKNITQAIWWGLSFANDLFSDVSDFWKEVWTKAFMWVGKGTANLIDFAWDVWAGVVDVWSGIASELTGKDLTTDLSWKEWFLDKANKHVQKWFKQIDDAMKSDIGKTMVGEGIVDLAGFAWEMAAPVWIVNKAAKGGKIASEYIATVKNSPKALSELKALAMKAKDEWREVLQTEIDDVLKKAGIAGKNIAKDAAKVTRELDPKTAIFIEKIANYSPEEIVSKWPKLAMIVDKTKGAGKLGFADMIRRMSDDEVNEVNAVVAEYDQPQVDDGLTMPDMPKEWKDKVSTSTSPGPEQKPDTISDKKKELETLKEKNAWDLNMGTSVVDLMKGLGVDSKQEARKLIFEKMTGKPYTASAEDNTQLKTLIEEAFSKGTLPDYFPSLKR